MPAVSWFRLALLVVVAWPFLMAGSAMAGVPAMTALVALLPLLAAVSYAIVTLDPVLALQLTKDSRVQQSWQTVRTVIVVELSLGAYFTFVPVHTKPFLVVQLVLVLVILGLSQAGGAFLKIIPWIAGFILVWITISFFRSGSASGGTLAAIEPAGSGPASRSVPVAPRAMPEPPARPLLDIAREQLPLLITEIFAALNDGNPRKMRIYLSKEILSDAETLDRMCRPYSYRAHYVERIVERPRKQFEVQLRVLFKPLDEHAAIWTFDGSGGEFVIFEAKDSRRREFPRGEFDADARFVPDMAEAKEIGRKLVYALEAGEDGVAAGFMSEGLDFEAFHESVYPATLREVMKYGAQAVGWEVVSDRGLKVVVTVDTPRVCGPKGRFFFDRIGERLRVVRMEWQRGCGPDDEMTFEDPGVEQCTLRRFGLAAPEK